MSIIPYFKALAQASIEIENEKRKLYGEIKDDMGVVYTMLFMLERKYGSKKVKPLALQVEKVRQEINRRFRGLAT